MALPIDEYVERNSISHHYPSIEKNRVLLLEKKEKGRGLPWRVIHVARPGPAYKIKNFELRFFEPVNNSIGRTRIFNIVNVLSYSFQDYMCLWNENATVDDDFIICPAERVKFFLWEMYMFAGEASLSKLLNLTQLAETLSSFDANERNANIDSCLSTLSKKHNSFVETWHVHFLSLQKGRIALKGWSANY